MNRLVAITLAIATGLAIPATTADAGPKGCPPGLAKKSPRCVPPGQAKKGVTAREWQGQPERYEIGDRISRDRYERLREGDRIIFDGDEYVVVDTDNGTILKRGDDWYRLPRQRDNDDYVRVDNDIFRINRETQEVIEVMRLVDLITG